MMDIEWLRKLCLSLPDATEQVQWGYDLVFKVGGKMFAIAPLEPARVCLTFKCSDESFAELTERPNIIPAPYLARAKWAALETAEAVNREELSRLIRESYSLVVAKLPKGRRTGKTAKEKPAKKADKPGKRRQKPGRRKRRTA
jgi:predicted DNA-binding protein (MmcQ/YjbR family)